MKIGERFIFPKASDFKLLQDYFDHMDASREECIRTEYHRVAENNENNLICYDCNLKFGKDKGIEYKVEDPLNP